MLTNEELKEIESQLRCPSGNNGIEMGINMNESNMQMILETIDFLDIHKENSILELGPGNAIHVAGVFEKQELINYHGLDISETMYKEANKLNKQLTKEKPVEFKLYNGIDIPYSDNYFDRIMTVNTVYFWSEPVKMMEELARCLKPNGICIITFTDKDFMKQLPFVGEKFKLYGENDIKILAAKSKLTLLETKRLTGKVKSKIGDFADRKFIMAILTKNE